MNEKPSNGESKAAVDLPRLVRPWDVVKHDCAASAIERETALLHEWNLTLRELRRLESEACRCYREQRVPKQ